LNEHDLDFIRVQGFYNVFQKVTLYLKTFLSYPNIVSCFLVFSIVNSRTISHDTQRGGGARWRHIIQYLWYQNIQDIIIKLTYSHSNSKIKKLTLIDVARYKSLIEQSYSCTIRYFDKPDSFCELVTWPTKIS